MESYNQFNNVNLFVEKLSNENEWNAQKQTNKKKIIYRFKNDNSFKERNK